MAFDEILEHPWILTLPSHREDVLGLDVEKHPNLGGFTITSGTDRVEIQPLQIKNGQTRPLWCRESRLRGNDSAKHLAAEGQLIF